MNKKYAVTGGAGFIGSHLVRALAEADNRIVVFDDLSVGSRAGIADLIDDGRVRLVVGNVTRPGDLAGVFDGADVVFHLAVLNLRACMTRPALASAVNVNGTLNVCLEAQRAGVSRFVYVSSSDIYGDVDAYPTPETVTPRPTTAYGATKLGGELVVDVLRRVEGFPGMVARPFNTYGSGEHVAGDSGEVLPRFILYALYDRPLPVFGDGIQTRSFTYIDDTVRGLIAAAACPEIPDTPVNIASSGEVSILDAARMILELVGGAGVEHLPARPGDMARQYADTSRARDLFGFEAATTLEQGLPHLIEYVRSLDINPDAIPRLWSKR